MITPEKGICANCGKHLKEHFWIGKKCPHGVGGWGPTVYEDSLTKELFQKQNTPSGRLLSIGFAKFILEEGYKQSRRKPQGIFFSSTHQGYKTIEELYDDYVGQGQNASPVPPTQPEPPKEKPTQNLDYRIRDGYKNRHIDGLPTKPCYIFVLHKENGAEQISRCYWIPTGTTIIVALAVYFLISTSYEAKLLDLLGAANITHGKYKNKILKPTKNTNDGFVWYAETANQ